MLLDENLFEEKGFVGTQKGEKRGPYKKREKKMDYNTIYDTLTDKGYTVYAGRDGLALSKHKEANLQKAIDFLTSLGIEYTIEYRGYPKKYHLNFSLPASMLDEPADVLMAEAVGKKLSFREFSLSSASCLIVLILSFKFLITLSFSLNLLNNRFPIKNNHLSLLF